MTPAADEGRAPRVRRRRAAAPRLLSCLAAWLFAQAGIAAQTPGTPAAGVTVQAPDECRELAETPWPITASGRAQLLTRLDSRREACIADASFLALLGALWLEQGDASQALLWLERSLMLEPSTPAAQADHALALAALGERTAARELLQRWAQRSDVPAVLRARLEAAARGSSAPRAGVHPSAAGSRVGSLTWRRTLSVLRGHETNLDHSPRLAEITLSTPDGPVNLPLAVPLEPRRGAAWAAEAALQALYSPDPGTLWQGGIQFGGRHAEREPETDTRQVQFAASQWRQHAGWRSQLQAAVQRVAGPLNEPYNTYTLGAAAEREWNGCWSRLGLDVEWRRQDKTRLIDSQTAALQTGLNCRSGAMPGWVGGIALRIGVDSPRFAERPGGRQSQSSLGLRAGGPLGWGLRIEGSARATWLLDREGYSPLLGDNARRRQHQQHLALELSRPLPALYVSGLDLVFQVQHLAQSSNLVLFRRSGRSVFAGLRADW